jgi:hypothetical protein
MHQKLLGSDASQIPLLPSPSDSQESIENSETENKDKSKYVRIFSQHKNSWLSPGKVKEYANK